MEAMNHRVIISTLTISLLVGCQSTSAPRHITNTTWTKPTKGAIPSFMSDEFNTKKEAKLRALVEYDSSETPLFDISTFQKCELTNDKLYELTSYDLIKETVDRNGSVLQLETIELKSTESGCKKLEHNAPINVEYYSYLKYIASGSKIENKAFTRLDSGGAMTNLTVVDVESGSFNVITYVMGDSKFTISQGNYSSNYRSQEYYTTAQNESVSVMYEGELMQSIVSNENNLIDGYMYLYHRKPSTACFKAGKISSDSYCDSKKLSPEALEIIARAKQAKKSRPIIKTIAIVTPPQQTNSDDSSGFWAIAGAVAATAYGVNEGLTTDSAAAIGAGTYDMISTGDSTQLTGAAESMQLERTSNSQAQQVSTTGSSSNHSVSNLSTDYANDLEIAKLKALIKVTKQQGGNTSSLESLLKSESSKTKKPNSRQVTLKPNLIDNYRFCQDPDLDIQISTHCQTAIVYYTQYIGAVGSSNENSVYDYHRKSAEITKKLYEATRQ